jgi:hypothetical protein
MTEPQAARREAVPALGTAAYRAGFIRTAPAGDSSSLVNLRGRLVKSNHAPLNKKGKQTSTVKPVTEPNN